MDNLKALPKELNTLNTSKGLRKGDQIETTKPSSLSSSLVTMTLKFSTTQSSALARHARCAVDFSSQRTI